MLKTRLLNMLAGAKYLMDDQMRLAIKRVSKSTYKAGGNIERVLMLLNVTTSGMRKETIAHVLVLMVILSMVQIADGSVDAEFPVCNAGREMQLPPLTTWWQFLPILFGILALLGIAWMIREIVAARDQLLLNAHNLQRHENMLAHCAQSMRSMQETLEKLSEEATMCADLLAEHDLKLTISPATGSVAASGYVVTVHPREQVLGAFEQIMRRRDVSLMNGDTRFVDALNQSLEDVADSLSIDSDEMDTNEGITYGAPSLQQEAQSISILHHEVLNQLELAANQSNWEAASMYRERLARLEELQLFLPDPDHPGHRQR